MHYRLPLIQNQNQPVQGCMRPTERVKGGEAPLGRGVWGPWPPKQGQRGLSPPSRGKGGSAPFQDKYKRAMFFMKNYPFR
ncbi:MAG: hypothetical protein EZS28_039443 [Streblomastix strix]|uniref:Uncharacterized protein n=1 Tax=Streblomastix strix TaxID=222440 RepID=A0A5J4U4V4_9EUKA|nr:MAG: hypothetical protein EZS28_039443 [Streblomastix strix]